MKQIFATIIKFLLSVFFFLSAILVTSFLDAQKSVYFENSISSELLAKRDIGIELPFPEIEKNIFNKPEKDESGAIVNLLPNDIQNKNIIEKENSDIQPKKHHKKNEQIKKELNPLKSRTQSKEEISKKEKTKEPKIQSKEKEVVVKIEKATKPTEIKKSIEKKEDLKIEKSAEEKQNESLSKKEEEPIIKIKKEEKEKKFPENLPKYIQGIYITNQTLFDKEKFSEIRKKVKLFGINTLVIDVQPKAIPKKILDDIHKDKIYTIARVVNFDGGLKTEQPSQKKKDALKSAVVFACESGFQEIQFDYIRYSDTNHKGLNIGKKYLNIEKFIEELKTAGRGCNKDLLFGADIFGRIPFVKHDRIGQNLERFSISVDVLYPMLYPSHFYGDRKKINNPYKTVFDGVVNSFKRSKKDTRVVPYIQGFSMSIKGSKLDLKDYILAQMKAAKESNSNGFIVWNAKNDYRETFKAIQKLN